LAQGDIGMAIGTVEAYLFGGKKEIIVISGVILAEMMVFGFLEN